jgi:hypothetical protein
MRRKDGEDERARQSYHGQGGERGEQFHDFRPTSIWLCPDCR